MDFYYAVSIGNIVVNVNGFCSRRKINQFVIHNQLLKRHCERSEAIHKWRKYWIASSLRSSQ